MDNELKEGFAAIAPAATAMNFTGAAIDSLAALGRDAHGCTVVEVKTDGLGAGLPPTVPILFDHRSDGAGVVQLKAAIEQFRLGPARRTGTAAVTTLKSLIDLINLHKDASSALFARTEWPEPKLTAVIDYQHHLEHRITYAFPVTDEFHAWIGRDGPQKPFSQSEFAGFVEEHAAELASPLPAEKAEYERLFKTEFATPTVMITLSRGLQVNVEAVVKNHVTLQSGEGEIQFAEEHLDKKGDKLTIPGLFMVSVPAFLDGDPIRLPARLRYRVSSGKVTWFYQLYRWKFWLRDRVQQDLGVVERETELRAFEGSPEK